MYAIGGKATFIDNRLRRLLHIPETAPSAVRELDAEREAMLECVRAVGLDRLLADGKRQVPRLGNRPAEACGCRPNRKHHRLSKERGDA